MVNSLRQKIFYAKLDENEISDWINDDLQRHPVDDMNGDKNAEENILVTKISTKHDDALKGIKICCEWTEENSVFVDDLIVLNEVK